MSEMSFQGTVWNNLSGLDISKHVQQRGKFSYLPWAIAWSLLMSAYPESEFEFGEEEKHGETVTVRCQVMVIEGDNKLRRSMWLPVMDCNNKAILNPDARAVSDTQMRCLVKTLALCGLGITLYNGDGLPHTSTGDLAANDRLRLGMVAESLIVACEKEDNEEVDKIMSLLEESELNKLFGGTPPEGFLKSKQKEAVGHQRHLFWAYLNGIMDSIMSEEDNSVLVESLGEMSNYAKKCLWGNLDAEEQRRIESLKEE